MAWHCLYLAAHMVNLFFYLDREENARQLVTALLRERLVAHAAISHCTVTMSTFNAQEEAKEEYVITAQTKAVLFDEVSAFVKNNFKGEIRIFSTPIAQCNDVFSEVIRTHTKDPG